VRTLSLTGRSASSRRRSPKESLPRLWCLQLRRSTIAWINTAVRSAAWDVVEEQQYADNARRVDRQDWHVEPAEVVDHQRGNELPEDRGANDCRGAHAWKRDDAGQDGEDGLHAARPGPPADFDEPAKGKATSALSAGECTASRDRLLAAIWGGRQRRSHHEQDEQAEFFRYRRWPAKRRKIWVGAYVEVASGTPSRSVACTPTGLTINALTGGRGRTRNCGSVTLEGRRAQSMIGRLHKEQMPLDFSEPRTRRLRWELSDES